MRKDQTDTLYNLLVYVILLVVFLYVCKGSADQTATSKIKQQIVTSALKNGIDPTLALAIAEVESGYNPDVIGSLGEIGVFQLRPEFHSVIRNNTKHNIDTATKYLAELWHKCAHYGDAYFVCFNYGSARRLKHPRLFPYYVKVKAAQKRLLRTKYERRYASSDQ